MSNAYGFQITLAKLPNIVYHIINNIVCRDQLRVFPHKQAGKLHLPLYGLWAESSHGMHCKNDQT